MNAAGLRVCLAMHIISINTPAMPMAAPAVTHKSRGFFYVRTPAGMRTFDKAAIPVDAQLDLLAKRGLSIQDRERAKKFLEVVSYFRLSAYMRPFQTHGHAFVAGARFQQVTQLYVFDQRLRLLVMEAIERVEVAMRALLGNHMGPTHGAHWYLQRNLFKDRYGHEKNC